MEALFKFWTSGKCLQRPGRCAKVYKKEALALKPHSPERSGGISSAAGFAVRVRSAE